MYFLRTHNWVPQCRLCRPTCWSYMKMITYMPRATSHYALIKRQSRLNTRLGQSVCLAEEIIKYTGCVLIDIKKVGGKNPVSVYQSHADRPWCESQPVPRLYWASHPCEPLFFLSYAFEGHKPQERGKRKLKINQDGGWFSNGDQIVMTKVFRCIPCIFHTICN